MNKPDIKTIDATIALIDNYPSMDIKELRSMLIKIKKIAQLPSDEFSKVSEAMKIIKN